MDRMINDSGESSVLLELCAFESSVGAGAAVTERPEWSRVDSALRRAFENDGFVDLRVLAPDAGLIKELTMKSIDGKYRLVALTRSTDPKLDLLEWWAPEDRPFRGMEKFGEDEWDARTVSSDLSHAVRVFQELFRDGDLSTELNALRSRWDRKPR